MNIEDLEKINRYVLIIITEAGEDYEDNFRRPGECDIYYSFNEDNITKIISERVSYNDDTKSIIIIIKNGIDLKSGKNLTKHEREELYYYSKCEDEYNNIIKNARSLATERFFNERKRKEEEENEKRIKKEKEERELDLWKLAQLKEKYEPKIDYEFLYKQLKSKYEP
jgi:hypothetical protein